MDRKIIQQKGRKNNQQQLRKYIESTLTSSTIWAKMRMHFSPIGVTGFIAMYSL